MRVLEAVLVLVSVSACGEPPLPPARSEVISVTLTPKTQLDLLLQVDNSSSTVELQIAAAVAIDDLLVALGPEADWPDLHVGLVTTDMGTSAHASAEPGPAIGSVGNGGCAGRGSDGMLMPLGGQPFLVDQRGSDGVRNYTGDLGTTIADAIRALGDGGCGFEQHLRAVASAVTMPTGFRRPEASLGILVVTDEDDCSANDTSVFDAEAPYGPVTSFRCTSLGVQCEQDIDTEGAKTGCVPVAQSDVMTDAAYLDELHAALASPDRSTVVGVIGGVPADVRVERTSNAGLTLAHMCSGVGVLPAAPAVRLSAFAEKFSSNGFLASACGTDYSPVLAPFATRLKRTYGIGCLELTPEAMDTRDCVVRVHAPAGAEVVERCTGSDDGTCFELVADAAACPETPDHSRLHIRNASSDALSATIECAPAQP